MATTRRETDSFGPIEVPADRYWGAQTQRSLQFFQIGEERMPSPVLHALALVKRACAKVNADLGDLDPTLAEAIIAAADEVISGRLDDHFPLSVWQTGSGTQSNMNVNEVIANRANERLGSALGSKHPVHPNDHVNMAQSTNDSFPTAMHIAAVAEVRLRLMPALTDLAHELESRSRRWSGLLKIGRTHLQDATPLTLGQEFGGYAAQVTAVITAVRAAFAPLLALAQGATAVGTGLNTRSGFAERVVAEIATLTHEPFAPASNRFAAIAAHDGLVGFMGALNTAAVALNKIANDIRLMGSGPRSGFGELRLPENKPGSSIMPGKVNPTQVEALTQICYAVFGHHVAVTAAGASGQLELNAYKPLIIHSVLTSIRLLGDASRSFTDHCVRGLEPDERVLREKLDRSLMLVTALAPAIGYDRAAAIARRAHADGLTLRQAALESGWVSPADFDRLVDARTMIAPRDK